MSRLLALSESAALASLWSTHDSQAPLVPQLLASLSSLEQQLHLETGFLANDELIQAKLRHFSQHQHRSYKQLFFHLLEGVKIFDPSHECIYGDFGDQFHLYQDNLHTMYRKTRHEDEIWFESIDSDLASVETVGVAGHVGDSDVDSLMDCGNPSAGASNKFELHKMLDSIQTRHQNISSVFLDIDDKLRALKKQNSSDMQFLDRLSAHNALMTEKTHDMRADISEICVELRRMAPQDEPHSAAIKPFQVPLDSAFLDTVEHKSHVFFRRRSSDAGSHEAETEVYEGKDPGIGNIDGESRAKGARLEALEVHSHAAPLQSQLRPLLVITILSILMACIAVVKQAK